MTVANNRLKELYDELLQIAETKLKEKDLVPKINIDAKLNLDEISLTLLEKVKKLEPFGLGNSRPIFALLGTVPENVRVIGKENKHLRFQIGNIKIIGFDWGFIKEQINNKKIDFAFTLDEDSWDGTRKVELKVVDIKI